MIRENRNIVEFNNYDAAEYGIKEGFNFLRTNLQFSGEGLNVFLVTSSLPSEGKSMVSFELACSMAETGKRVILIDADLRKSVMLSRYKISAKNKGIGGLSHYLTGQAKMEDIICSTNISNFSTILTGPIAPNPTELLGNASFDHLIQKLRETFDAVIIDAPPLGAVIDAAVIAPRCDGAILVVETEVVSYRMVQHVKKQLEVTDCKILGVVLNKYDTKNGGRYDKYYGKYYGKEK